MKLMSGADTGTFPQSLHLARSVSNNLLKLWQYYFSFQLKGYVIYLLNLRMYLKFFFLLVGT